MITLTVTSFKGAAVENLSVGFDELGGTIGRADTNQMVLADPERAISRVHAQIVFRGGAYALIGRGANAVLHNGASVGSGSEVMLAPGDEIEIGSYRIVVSSGQATSKVDPFEAAFGDGNKPARVSPAASTRVSRANPAEKPPEKPPVARQTKGGPGKASGVGIPDDWDPFARDTGADPFGEVAGAAAQRQVPPPGADPLRAMLPASQPGREDSIDALFGLGGAASTGDPFAASSPLASAAAQPNTAASADPVRSLQELSKAGPKSEADHVSDLNSPWVNARHSAKAAPAVQAPALPGAVLSWDTPSRETKFVGQQPPAASATLIKPPPREAQRPGARARVAVPAGSHAAIPAANAENSAARDAELLQALREGLGAAELRFEPMSPELMRLVGQLLRESIQGTVELLAARAALKREVRAEVTMIVAKENNPLKFSPSVEVALQYMLGPKMGGFMPPVQSMRDAVDDLKAHQLGVMAGMKAALAGVLERFDPAVVESKLTARSSFSNLMPRGRKARLWELFQELYQQLATEAEEDFNTLFGRAFLKAYQQYIDQLEGPNVKE